MSYDIRPGRPEDEPNPRERAVFDEHPVHGGSAAGLFVGATGSEAFGTPLRRPFSPSAELTQLALRRYLLTRAIGASVVRTVHWFGIAVLVLAVAVWSLGVPWLAVLIGLFAVVVLLVRTMLSGIQRRISGIAEMGVDGAQVERMVGQTRKGLRAELRRVGLPSAPWGPLLVGIRLIRPERRADTVAKLARFDLSQVVPSRTLDELLLLLSRPGRR